MVINQEKAKKILRRPIIDKPDEVNEVSEYLFQLFKKNDLGKDDYKRIFNNIHNRFSPQLRQRISKRLDVRSLGEFALEIFENASSAPEWLSWWWKRYGEHYFPGQTWKPNGIAHEGAFVFSGRGFDEPDYRLTNLIKLEFKEADSNINKETFKTADIKSYLKHKCYILVIVFSKEKGRRSKPRFWTLISPEEFQRMSEKAESFKAREFWGKESIQFWTGYSDNEVHEHMRARRINPKSLKLDDFTKVHWL